MIWGCRLSYHVCLSVCLSVTVCLPPSCKSSLSLDLASGKGVFCWLPPAPPTTAQVTSKSLSAGWPGEGFNYGPVWLPLCFCPRLQALQLHYLYQRWEERFVSLISLNLLGPCSSVGRKWGRLVLPHKIIHYRSNLTMQPWQELVNHCRLPS